MEAKRHPLQAAPYCALEDNLEIAAVQNAVACIPSGKTQFHPATLILTGVELVSGSPLGPIQGAGDYL